MGGGTGHLEGLASRLIQQSFRVWRRSGSLLGPAGSTKLKRIGRSSSSIRRRGNVVPVGSEFDTRGAILGMMEVRRAFLDVLHGTRTLQAMYRSNIAKRMEVDCVDRDNPPYSPAVFLHGKQICGNPIYEDDKDEDGYDSPSRRTVDELPADLSMVEIEIEPEEPAPKPSLIPRRVRRSSSVQTGEPKSSSKPSSPPAKSLLKRSDPMVDECGLPIVPAQLNRLTIDNTKRNSTYKTCEVSLVLVPKDAPKPESPERGFSKKSLPQIQRLPSGDESDDDTTASGGIRWEKRVVLLDELAPKAPLDPEISIPVKPILKRSSADAASVSSLLEDLPKATVQVTKFVYPDDEEYQRQRIESAITSALDMMIESNSLELKGKKGKKKQVETPVPQKPVEPEHSVARNERRLKGKPNRVPVRKSR